MQQFHLSDSQLLSFLLVPFVLPTSAGVKKGESQTLWYFGLNNDTDLTWYKKQGRISTKINESAKYKIRDDPVHHLKITDFQQCDEGEYVCSSGQNVEIRSFLNIGKSLIKYLFRFCKGSIECFP